MTTPRTSEVMVDTKKQLRPPRDNLVRAISPGVEVRDASNDGGMPTLVGHFALFNEWAEIDSAWEGRFMEQIAPSAFDKTFAENRSRMRVTFNHGQDPSLGDKVLGPIDELKADEKGAWYEVPLFDTQYNRELLPALQANQYGASFRFRVMREDITQEPKRSAHNPDALPERTITEAQVFEFGPVTYPAYAGASAGVRSLTDEMFFGRLAAAPKHLSEVIDYLRSERTEEASDDAGESHLEEQTALVEAKPLPPRFRSREEFLQWISQS